MKNPQVPARVLQALAFDRDVSAALARVHAQVKREQNSVADLMAWARKEQAKVTDPKARSYSVLAQYIQTT